MFINRGKITILVANKHVTVTFPLNLSQICQQNQGVHLEITVLCVCVCVCVCVYLCVCVYVCVCLWLIDWLIILYSSNKIEEYNHNFHIKVKKRKYVLNWPWHINIYNINCKNLCKITTFDSFSGGETTTLHYVQQWPVT